MKSKLSKIFAVVLVVFFIGYLLVTSIMDLTNRKDLYEVDLSECAQLMTIEHAINGIIPIGKEYYFLGLDSNGIDVYFIRADKTWYKTNFDAKTGKPKGGNVHVKALCKSVSGYEMRDALSERADQLVGLNIVVGPDKCLYQDYLINSYLKLLCLFVGLIIVFTGVIMSKKHLDFKGLAGKMLLIFVIVWLFICLKVFTLN